MKFRYLIGLLFFFMPIATQAQTISENVAGKILLDVEDKGQAWYVHPDSLERHYLGSPDNAFSVMRDLGLGITNENLEKIVMAYDHYNPTDTDDDGLPDEFERFIGTNPVDPDSDDDGYFDSTEVEMGYSPTGIGGGGIDPNLAKAVSGKILLQVERRGEAWYVNPVNNKRYYLGNRDQAYDLMRVLGLGITHTNLNRIPVAESLTTYIDHDLLFTAQAPFGNWNDLRQQEACEEASVYMAYAWATGATFTLQESLQTVTAMSDWQKSTYGSYIDTSAQDTATRLLDEYLGFKNYEVVYNINTEDLKQVLADGDIAIVHTNGKKLRNPYFEAGGPLRHAVVVKGYDPTTKEFITHEPGTRQGANYRYHQTILADAFMDYTSGEYEPVGGDRTSMIIIRK